MIEEQAYVVKVEDKNSVYAWVETQRKSSCGSCLGKSSCGTQVLSKIVGKRPNQIKVFNNCHAKVGDLVVIAIEDKLLLSGSFQLYFIPLMAMILASFMANFISLQLNLSAGQVDFNSIIFAIIGFISGMLLVRFKINKAVKKDKNNYQAIISKVILSNTSVSTLLVPNP